MLLNIPQSTGCPTTDDPAPRVSSAETQKPGRAESPPRSRAGVIQGRGASPPSWLTAHGPGLGVNLEPSLPTDPRHGHQLVEAVSPNPAQVPSGPTLLLAATAENRSGFTRQPEV